jgi:hypothetical protein
VKYGTVHALRSSAAHFWIWDLLQIHPNRLTLGFRDKPTVVLGCSPTDEVAYTYFADGMRRRLGDKPKPSMVFLLTHALWIARYLISLFAQAVTCDRKLELARAIVTHIACETFGLGPTIGLPPGICCVLLALLEQTKSKQVRTADLVLAYMSASDLEIGPWLERLKDFTLDHLCTPDCYILCHPDGHPWTSHYFRYTHLYPALSVLHPLGYPYLSKFDDTPSKELTRAFWSFNMYRQYGRTIGSKKRVQTL